MQKSGEMLRLERVTGRDIRQIVTEALARAGSVPDAAKALGLSDSGLYKWIRDLDGELKTAVQVSFADFEPLPADAEAEAEASPTTPLEAVG